METHGSMECALMALSQCEGCYLLLVAADLEILSTLEPRTESDAKLPCRTWKPLLL